MAKNEKPGTPSGDATPDPKALGKALFAVLQGTTDGQIAGDKDHGWVAADSMAVIESLVAEDAALSKAETGKYTMSEECLKMVAVVVNPSGYRQQLEKDGKLTVKEGKRQSSLKNLAAQYGS